MATKVATSESGYTNRPSTRSQEPQRASVDSQTGRHATGRAVDRMRLALRAYEQRAERRAQLQGWMVARAALSSRT